MANSSNNSNTSDSKDSKWYFTAEQLAHSPSRRHGIDADQELSFRQLTAYLIQEMGQRLQVSQLCINTAIVYMHRFYTFHSFTHFHRNGIAAASLFLAAKVEEQPRKLEHVIKVAHMCLNQDAPHPSTDLYAEQAQDLVFNENVLLQTLGFDVAIDHPHTHVVKTCHLVKACKDLAQTSYFLASNSLHLTPMCLQYRPTVVACFCIYLACKWSRWEIPQSTEGKHWFHYVDKTVTMDLLKQLTDEFIAIYEKSPARLKSKLNSIKALAQGARIPEPARNISESSSNGSNPPPAQVDQTRRPESYSSHHRSHHSSSHPSASHHHHSKQPPSNDAGAMRIELAEKQSSSSHKQAYPPPAGSHSKQPPPNDTGAMRIELVEKQSSSSHKQAYPPPAGSHSNRPRQERSQIHTDSQYTVPSHGGNKQIPPSSSSNRSCISSRPSHSSSSQRIPHGHDPNYHKNRNTAPSQMNPPLSSHKLLPKNTDAARSILKDSSGRPIDPSKLATKHSSSSNTMYPPANPVNNTGVDMTRSIMQQQQSSGVLPQQRPYVPPSTQSSNSNRNSNNTKYEQSVQPQSHLHLNQKQSIESSFNTTNTRSDEGAKSMDQMDICSPPNYSSFTQQSQNIIAAATTQHQHQQQPQIPQSKPSSIFSPEWNEKTTIMNTGIVNNSSSNSNNSGNHKLAMGMKSSRDSPKRSDRERKSETPKKDKIRNEMQIHDHTKVVSNEKRHPLPAGGISKRSESQSVPPQNIAPSAPFDMKGQQTHALNFSGIKRSAPNDGTSKLEDEGYRENKIIKLEPPSPPKMMDIKAPINLSYDQQQLNVDARLVKSFPVTVNGIETNPDLVSNILKESLCTDNKFGTNAIIKTEPKEPQNLSIVEAPPIMETVPQQILQTETPAKEESVPSVEEFIKSKSEKKKKKDKHKHKEKDKSKDKEERKKHKKDKDKHKEKERNSSGPETSELNPVKIKIPKDKLNLPLLEPPNPPTSGFKIKIPKDRIKGELSNFPMDEGSNSISMAPPPPSPLKIKISKDKIENYNHPPQDITRTTNFNSGNIFHSHSSSSSSSSSSKKKDRDRDKDKKRNSNDYNKQNGSGTGGASGTSGSSSKGQSSGTSKIQQYNNSMSQLFGEYNDDDEDGLLPHKSILQQHQQRYTDNKYNIQQQQQIGSNYYNK